MAAVPKGLAGQQPPPGGERGQMPGMPFTVIFILHRKPWEPKDESVSSTCKRSRRWAEGSAGEGGACGVRLCAGRRRGLGRLRQTGRERAGAPGSGPAWPSIASSAVNAGPCAQSHLGRLPSPPPRNSPDSKTLSCPSIAETISLAGGQR